MIVFDNWKFREILKSIVKEKELNGDRISSKQQLNIGREINPVDLILEPRSF